jgi:uncharacterized membrane protein HdeD (DUF308 family)
MVSTRIEMTTGTLEDDVRDDIRGLGLPWWLFLIFGLGWIFVALFVLQFDLDSVVTISLLTGVYLLAAAATEAVFAVTMPGWKWLHWVLAALFTFGGIWAFVYPGQTFGTLAILIGWYLLVKGTFDFVAGLMSRGVHLWWLTMIVGIAQILIAFWAIGYPGRSAWLLVFWVGISALTRGIADIFLAFQVRSLQRGVRL